MAVVTVQLGIDAVVNPLQAGISPLGFLPLGIAILSLVLILRYSLNSAWLVLGGGLLGWAAQMVF
jgi:chromate transporter